MNEGPNRFSQQNTSKKCLVEEVSTRLECKEPILSYPNEQTPSYKSKQDERDAFWTGLKLKLRLRS